jgi:hypothetical protein
MIEGNYIVFNKILHKLDSEERLEAAGDMADEMKIPVMIRLPYRRRYLVFPQQEKDLDGHTLITEKDES